ncbi:MAG: M14 family zinc carboxypeptidase [Capsulimonadaceae bacterium]|nr:M14 family zinc carboxypeptidase [Capsulimonadaceae bacterium]
MLRWAFVLSLGISMLLTLPAHAVTSYSTMVGRLANLADRSSLIKLYDLGKSSSGDRSVWLTSVSDPSVDPRKTVRILILCRQHGDEPASTEAALEFLDHVANGTAAGARDALRHASLYIVPMVNPDGADLGTRENAKKVDLNRDWGHFNAAETSLVNKACRSIRPAFVLDMHSWDQPDPFRSNCFEASRDAGAAASAERDLQRRAVDEISDGTGQAISATSYHSGIEDTLCHRYMTGWLEVPSLLFETAAGPSSGPGFDRRVGLARATILWLLRDTAAHPDAWKHLVKVSACDRIAPSLTFGAASTVAKAPAPPAAPHRRGFPVHILWAIAAYVVVAICVARLRPVSREPGYIRIERVGEDEDGRPISRAVYVPSGEYKRHVLTRTGKR